jgi:hypothetical protein
MKSQLQTVGISLGSAVIGALVVAWFQARTPAAQISAPSSPSATAAPVQVRVLSSNGDPALAQRLTALEQQVAARDEAPPDTADEPPIDREEAEARTAQRHEEQRASFEAQAVDRSWAPDTARAFEADFEIFEGRAFHVGQVDCRTSVCRTQLTWDSYEAALADSRNVVQHRYATNCARVIQTPTPSEPSAPYTATVYFDCANLRGSAN